jgi:phage terminase large subunit GpA-like protein
LAAIDANYTTDDVLGFCQHHSPSRVIAVRGIGGDSTPRLARVQRERSKGGVVLKFSRRFFNVGTYPLKASLYRDLAKDDPAEKGYISFPNDLPLSFYEELVAERRIAQKRAGVLVHRWEKISDRQSNDLHDAVLYATAAAIRAEVNWISDQGWGKLRAELETPVTRAQGGDAARPSLASQLAR